MERTFAQLDDHTLSAADVQAWGPQSRITARDSWTVWDLRRRYAQGMQGQGDAFVSTAYGSVIPVSWRMGRGSTDSVSLWGKRGMRMPHEWGVTSETYGIAAFVAQSEIGAGRPMLAFAVLEAMRPWVQSSRIATAQAADVAGSAFYAMRRWEPCLTSVRAGLAALDRRESSADVTADTPEIAVLRCSLRQLKRRAEHELDTGRYGPAFVAYREAEHQRRFADDPVSAWVGYQRIATAYPDSVFAEASRAYSIACLLEFAGPGFQRRLLARMDHLERQLADLADVLSDMRRGGASTNAIAEQQRLIDEQRALSSTVAALPAMGRDAVRLALQQGENFVRANPDGLYRGEVLAYMGDCVAECEVKPGDALAYYQRAMSWCDTISTTELHLDQFSLEPRCARVAAPPPAMRSTDAWGNTSWTKPQAGAVVNHRDTSWYTTYWRTQIALRMVACHIATGHVDEALALLPLINQLDPHQQVLAQRGWPTIERRLRDDVREGRFFATTAEMAVFPKTAMPKLVMAELAYETERYDRARDLYVQLRDDFDGSLNPSALAYLDYHRAIELAATRRRDSLQILRAIAADPSLASWTRAKMDLFIMTQTMDADGGGALQHLDDILAARPRTPEAARALYVKASFLTARKRYADAARLFEMIRRKADQPWLVAGATRFLLGMGPEPANATN
ncbi:MAG: hypothetical protein J0M02_00515 [Planctomycetes bacterium]|nr:hypothetical protein [Planctomycetota bacterium]